MHGLEKIFFRKMSFIVTPDVLKLSRDITKLIKSLIEHCSPEEKTEILLLITVLSKKIVKSRLHKLIVSKETKKLTSEIEKNIQ
jgi:hypothetical protein